MPSDNADGSAERRPLTATRSNSVKTVTDGSTRWDDASAARDWLTSEINKRWPSVDPDRPAADRDTSPTDGHLDYIAYAPRSS